MAGGLLATPLAALAQQTKVYRVGMLFQGSADPPGSSVTKRRRIPVDTLRELGYIEGQNLIIAESTPGGVAAMRTTAVIPIVLFSVSDPVGSGLVSSLAHPGGNITGITDFGVELAAKEMDLLHALFAKATRFAVLTSDNPVHPFQFKAIEDAARAIGLTVTPERGTSLEEMDGALASMARKKTEAAAKRWR